MKKGLDRLRIALGMGLLSTAVLAATRSARAGTTGVSGTVVAGNVSWFYSNSTYGNSGAPFGSCGGKRAAQLVSGLDRHGRPLKNEKVPASPNGSGSGGCGFGLTEAKFASGANDALDGGLVMAVNGTVFQNPDGSLDINGSTITSDVVNIGGLDTQVQFYFDAGQSAVRALYSYTNTTAAPIAAAVLIDNNLGSDSDTVIEATGDGDQTVEPNDTWFATNDSGGDLRAPDGGGDPPLTWIRYSQGALVTPNAQALQAATGVDFFRESFSLNVAAGATQRIMLILKLNTSIADSVAAGPALDTLSELQAAGLLNGLSAQQQLELANWSPSAVTAGPARAVPATGLWGQLGLMLTLAVGGMAAVRLGTRAR